MLTEQMLSGIYVPVVTPFNSKKELDLESFCNHVTNLLKSGIHGLIVNGTTGESPTIQTEEINKLTTMAKQIIGSQIPLVIGTGTNDTSSTIQRTELAKHHGADAALVVVPYYSRPSQEGIIQHFKMVTKVGLPVIVYEIPYRTGVTLAIDTLQTILNMDGVIGLKDSSGGIHLVSELSRIGSKPILCGEDENFFASLCCGAKGGMLASANVDTKRFVQVYNLFAAGLMDEAKQTFDELFPLIHLLFSEANPAPLKWLLNQRGLIASNDLRLPMTMISPSLQEKLRAFV